MNNDRILMKSGLCRATRTAPEQKKMEKMTDEDEECGARWKSQSLPYYDALDEWFIVVQKVKHIQNFRKYSHHLRTQTYFILFKSNIEQFVYTISSLSSLYIVWHYYFIVWMYERKSFA